MRRICVFGLVVVFVAAGATLDAPAPVSKGGFLYATASAANEPKKRSIHVDDDAALGGDGSARSPFDNLADALAEANASAGAVVVKVAPGDYAVEGSLVIDRSLELRGSTILLEDADGWPTGAVVPGTATRVFTTNPLGSQPLVAVGRADAIVISDVEIRGLVLESGLNRPVVSLTRVQGYAIVENAFRAPGLWGVQSTASSGRVLGNYFSGVATGIILNAGYDSSPSNVTVAGNRAVQNTIGGLLLNGASIDIPEHGDQLDAVIRDNDLSNNTLSANGFGARLFILRRDPGAPGETQATGNVRALLQDNRIVGNRIGMTIDAGFPYRRVGTTCDPRVFSGTIDLTLEHNTLTNSLLTPALVTFTRNMAALNPGLLAQWQYLHGATFIITDPAGTLAGAWIDHPERDPIVGPCPGDAVQESLDNTLRYNGEEVEYGRNF
jgi:hypothetical protein